MKKHKNWTIVARLSDGERTRRQNMAKIAFSWGGGGGVTEMKCILFNQNNNNPYQISNNYIKLSIVFRPMQFFSRK